MYRTHNCGELNINNLGQSVVLSGWVQRIRNLGGMTFIDLRDRYGITQLAFNEEWEKSLMDEARELGREYVIQAEGEVIERSSKNAQLPTGEIEIKVQRFTVLNKAKTPPFTIEDQTDGGEELRMKYRYLDIRRNPIRENLRLRSELSLLVRNYLSSIGFMEVETPFLIKSTPEGARDFIVPSRINEGQFYALPQSPQTFKQLLMVSGIDKYYQIVKCFRDEDLRADRQPEFTQIDCEMSFVDREDILRTFEGMLLHILRHFGVADLDEIPRMSYDEAMEQYGTDKPDIRFDMRIHNLNELSKHRDFGIFNQAELVAGICVKGKAEYTRKQLDALTDFVKKPQLGGTGLIWCKYQEDGSLKSSVDKFFEESDLHEWARKMQAEAGDLMLIMAGDTDKTRKILGELRLHLAQELDLRRKDEFAPLWVLDFPLLEWDEESQRYFAMHHPFTSPYPKDLHLLDSDPGSIRANAYDLVLNGNEIGGGSIRIHDRQIQQKMFEILGFSQEEAQKQFGFLMEAFEYGAPPHGGIALGFDRLTALLAGRESIRDFIAFPKNNAGRDLMIDAPSTIDQQLLADLSLSLKH